MKDYSTMFTLDKAQLAALGTAETLIEGLIVRGHLTAIVAPPNGGKTTLLMDVAGKLVQEGMEVYYVNVDVSGPDIMPMAKFAEDRGFAFWTPDATGASTQDVLNAFSEMIADADHDQVNQVFIVDTLKKFGDVINKSKLKRLLNGFRGMTAKGATVILLAHTNKHQVDGRDIYEGTGDLRADVDELIYLEIEDKGDTKLITTRVDKRRSAIEPVSFELNSKSRKVTYLDQAVPVRNIDLDDLPVIQSINGFMKKGKANQTDIINHCTDNGISRAKCRRILQKYSADTVNQVWYVSKGMKNASMYKEVA